MKHSHYLAGVNFNMNFCFRSDDATGSVPLRVSRDDRGGDGDVEDGSGGGGDADDGWL